MSYPITRKRIQGLPETPFRNGVGKYEGVVAHATASYAPAENLVTYFQNNWKTREAFVQYIVDWTSIVETSNPAYKAWGAGYTANQRYVHVELCQTRDGKLFKESYARYVWLLASLLYDKGLGVVDGKTLVSHDWCSRTFQDTTHTDPIGYLQEHGVSWGTLVKDVKTAYAQLDNPLENDLAKLAAAGILKNEEYWRNVASGKEVAKPQYVAQLLKNMADRC